MGYQLSLKINNNSETIAIGLFANQDVTKADYIESPYQDLIEKVRATGDFSAKAGDIQIIYPTETTLAKRVILFGLGEEAKFNLAMLRKAMQALGNLFLGTQLTSVAICVPLDKTKKVQLFLRQTIMTLNYVKQRRDQLKTEHQKTIHWPQTISLIGYEGAAAEKALLEGEAIAAGIELTRHLGDLPPNHCTPKDLAAKAEDLAKEFADTLKVTIYDEKQIAELGMGCFLAVNQGSAQPPRLIVFEYKGAAADQAPYALVGKGVTFDTGGISLKPGPRMDEMKYDMCGAASVFGTMKAVAKMRLPINLVGVVVATENMPGGKALKPGDVIRSMKGLTVEVLNTDAEGRLILADALTFTERFKPKAVVNIATLTGAMVITLGEVASGLMTNNQILADKVLQAGQDSWDRVWQLPLWDEYQELIDTPFADIANLGMSDGAKSIAAGCFLERFAKAYPWVHLDIAGTAYMPGHMQRMATGRPVGLLTQFLLNEIES